MDISEEAVKNLRKEGINAIRKSSQEMNYKEEFDVVVCSHVLEHIEYQRDLYKTMKNIYSALRKGGSLIIIGPYLYGFNAWFQYDHVRAFTLTSTIGLIERFGFKTINKFLFIQSPFQRLWNKFNIRLKCPIKIDYFLKLLAHINLVDGINVLSRKQ